MGITIVAALFGLALGAAAVGIDAARRSGLELARLLGRDEQ